MTISLKEYERRYQAVRKAMERDGLGALLVVGRSDDFNRGNIRYLTGWGNGGYCIFPLEDKPVFFVRPNEARSNRLRRTLEAYDLLDLRELSSPEDEIVKELLRCSRGNRVGLTGQASISVQVYSAIKEKLGVDLVDVPEYLRPFREVKSAEEIRNMKKGALIADKVYQRLREILRPGLTECQVYAEVKRMIYAEGCEYSFDLLDGMGSIVSMTSSPSEWTLEPGQVLFVEISPAYRGYYAQLPVTLPVGGGFPPHFREMVSAWRDAMDKVTRKLLRPGVTVSEICHELMDAIHQRGFVSPLRPGHSIGLDILDFWSLTPSNHTVLKAGMTLVVHPCCMSQASTEGIGMGYTYLVTDEGAEKLSNVDLAHDLLDV